MVYVSKFSLAEESPEKVSDDRFFGFYFWVNNKK